jgi:hypothetical protein
MASNSIPSPQHEIPTAEPGEVVLACSHEVLGPSPYHWFRYYKPWHYKLDGGEEGEARWVMLCAACFSTYATVPGAEQILEPIALTAETALALTAEIIKQAGAIHLLS